MRKNFILAACCFTLALALIAKAQVFTDAGAGNQTTIQTSAPNFQVGDVLSCAYTNLSTVTCVYTSCPTPKFPGQGQIIGCPTGVVTYAPITIASMSFQSVATAANTAWHTAQGY